MVAYTQTGHQTTQSYEVKKTEFIQLLLLGEGHQYQLLQYFLRVVLKYNVILTEVFNLKYLFHHHEIFWKF